MIQNIVFDMGGVLIDFRSEEHTSELKSQR